VTYKRATAYLDYRAGDIVQLSGAPSALTGEVEAEPGVLLCNGQAVSRARYPKLFARIGTLYGVGDGSTTFNLPNTQGRMITGRNAAETEFDTPGKIGGAETHTLALSEIPSHAHTYFEGGTGNFHGINEYTSTGYSTQYPNNLDTAGGGGAHENRAPFQVANFGVVYI
jgi:microcystin-dependent protein